MTVKKQHFSIFNLFLQMVRVALAEHTFVPFLKMILFFCLFCKNTISCYSLSITTADRNQPSILGANEAGRLENSH